MTYDVELLWFADCPNHQTARRMLAEVIAELAPGTPIRDLDATDPVTAERLRFPGIADHPPGWPRCRSVSPLPSTAAVQRLRRDHPEGIRPRADATPARSPAELIKEATNGLLRRSQVVQDSPHLAVLNA